MGFTFQVRMENKTLHSVVPMSDLHVSPFYKRYVGFFSFLLPHCVIYVFV